MGLVYSLLTMIRAHEESDTKSKRVKAAMVARCKQWLAETYRGPVGARQTARHGSRTHLTASPSTGNAPVR